jgi:DNA recombination protein RmuC
MNDFLFILIIFLIVAGGVAIFFSLSRKSRIDERQSEAIRDLERRLTDLMINQLKEIRGSVDGTSQAMQNQIFSFTKETVQLREELKKVQETMKEISSFQEIFKMPKLRGEWGEANLAHILSEYFPKELYIQNFKFSSGAQVEFALKLPNKKILPIDAKFFSENFEKMKNANSEEERKIFQKKLIQDLKFNINEISTKYIIPAENTVDFALMFIPAEAIFYELMFNLREEDVAEYARSKKVILTSPNTIYLTLRTILDWFRDTQISRQTQEILRRLNRIQAEADKLMEDFRKLGGHLRNAISAYDNSERHLNLFSDKLERLLGTGEVPNKNKFGIEQAKKIRES